MPPTNKQTVSFELDYLAFQYDTEGREQYRMKWRSERVYMVRFPADLVDDEETFQIRRLSDDKPLGTAAPSKEDAASNARRCLMNETYREGAAKAYSR